MQWLIYVLAYAGIGSLAAFFDKILLNYKIDPTSISSFRLMGNAVIALPLLLLLGFQIPSTNIFMLVVVGAVLYSIASITYFIALSKDDVSKLVPYRDSIFTIVAFVLAVIFLAESTSLFRLLGAIAIALGGYFVVTNGRMIVPKASSALLLMGLSTTLVAVFSVIAKTILTGVTPISLVFYNYFLIGLILFGFNFVHDHKNQTKTLKQLFSNKNILVVSLFASLFAVVAWYLLFTALTIGDASQVLPVAGVLPLFVALEGWLVLKEKYGLPRLLATCLVVLGIYAIYA